MMNQLKPERTELLVANRKRFAELERIAGELDEMLTGLCEHGDVDEDCWGCLLMGEALNVSHLTKELAKDVDAAISRGEKT